MTGKEKAEEQAMTRAIKLYIDRANSPFPLTKDQAIEQSGLTDLDLIKKAREAMDLADDVMSTIGEDGTPNYPNFRHDGQVH
jgi:hypothetical protein